MAAKIVLTECSWGATDVEEKYLKQEDFQVEICSGISEEELLEACRDADAIIAEYAPLTRKVLSGLERCKIISNSAIGVDNIDIQAARELGIAVANVPNYCAYEVADHAMALMLAALRNVVHYERKVRRGIWDINDAPPMRRLAGLKLGLLGFGCIPQMVARRAKGFEMEVMAYDPYLPPEAAAKLAVPLVSMEEILESCDIISCHIPLTPGTTGLINKEIFGQMQQKPLFINTSRGKVVAEQDMVEALKSGQIRGAALDVLKDEPPCFSDEIFQLPNVIITPHAAFFSEEALEEVRRRSAMNVVHFFQDGHEKISFIVKP